MTSTPREWPTLKITILGITSEVHWLPPAFAMPRSSECIVHVMHCPCNARCNSRDVRNANLFNQTTPLRAIFLTHFSLLADYPYYPCKQVIMFRLTVAAVLVFLVSKTFSLQYELTNLYTPANFFEEFRFFTVSFMTLPTLLVLNYIRALTQRTALFNMCRMNLPPL